MAQGRFAARPEKKRMKKIGVISDTHIPHAAKALPPEVERHFRGVDLILHAGDLERLHIIDDLELIAPVKAVCGNMDIERDPNLAPEKRIVEVEDCRIGLFHGWGSSNGLVLRVRREFDDSMQCIVFGHSHSPFNETVSGTLMFNPGSATNRRSASHRSIGILTVEGKNIKGEIIRL